MSKTMIELAEQAAMFALAINTDRKISPGFNGGQAEICSLVAEEAIKFCAETNGEDYWESHDWYEESDKWFDKNIAPALYGDMS